MSYNESNTYQWNDTEVQILIIDPQQMQIVDANEAAIKLLGYFKNELLQLPVQNIDVDFIDTNLSAAIENILNSPREQATFPTRYRKKDGTVCNAEIHLKCYDETGKTLIRATIKLKNLHQPIAEKTTEFTEVFERITDCFIAHDSNWNIVYINKNAAAALGKTTDELIGKNAWEMFPATVDTHVYQLFHQALREQKVIRATEFVEHFNKWFEGIIYPSPEGISVFFQDVSYKKQAEAALVESEHNFRTIVENAQEGIWMVDDKEITTYINDYMLKLLGYAREEIINRPATELLSPEYSVIGEAVIAARKQGLTGKQNIALIKKDGTTIHLESNSSPIIKEGRYKGIVATLLDLTEIRKVEEQIRASEKRFRSLFENSYDGIALLNQKGTIIEVSPAIERILGLKRSELIGTARLDYIHPDDVYIVYQTFEKVLHNPQLTISVQYRAIMPDKSQKWLECTYSNLLEEPNVNAMVLNFRDITSDKIAEEKLKDSEARYKKAQSLGNLGHWEMDLKTNEIFWSEEIYKMYDVHQLNSPPDYELFLHYVHEEDREMVDAEMKKALSTGNSIDLIHRIVLDNGEIKYVHEVADFVLDNEDRPVKVTGMVQDVTRQQQVENQLSISEKNYRALFQKNPIPMWMLEYPSLNFIEVNEAVVAKYGYSREEFLQMNVRELSARPDEDLLKNLNDNFLTDINIEAIAEHRKKSGAIIFVKIYLGRFQYNNKPVRLVAGRDITNEILYEKKLKESQEQLLESQRIAQIGSWEISFKKDEEVIKCPMKCSPETYRLFRLPEHDGEITFISLINKIYPSDRSKVKDWFEKVLENKKIDSLDYCIAIDHSIRWVQQDAQVIEDPDTKKFKMYGSIKDITVRKEHELQIQKILEERELLIAELTRSINDLKQFGYITSHNFRAPLSNLIGLLSLIDLNGMTEDNRQLLQLFKASTKQLDKTINDLIQILIIKNSVNISEIEIDMQELVTEVADLLSYDIRETTFKIECELEVKHITYNKAYFQSILINLISNAIKYRSPERELLVTVRTRKDANNDVVLEVADNGLGIDLNRHRDKMFGLYQRFHSNKDGEGLGLFIVKSQITALGGTIDVESEEGKGSTFIITFKNR